MVRNYMKQEALNKISIDTHKKIEFDKNVLAMLM